MKGYYQDIPNKFTLLVYLELQPMRIHFVPETEWSAQVTEEHLLVLTLADYRHQHAVHDCLVLLALG